MFLSHRHGDVAAGPLRRIHAKARLAVATAFDNLQNYVGHVLNPSRLLHTASIAHEESLSVMLARYDASAATVTSKFSSLASPEPVQSETPITNGMMNSSLKQLGVNRNIRRFGLRYFSSYAGHDRSRLFLLQTSPLFQQQRSRSFGSMNRIARLEDEADAAPTNAKKQAEYYRAIVADEASEVVRRYESGKYAANESCYRAYLRALVLTDQIEKVPLTKITTATTGGGAGESTQANHNGTEDRPMHVLIGEASFGGQLWKLIRTLGLAILILSAVNAMVEERGLGKALPGASEVLPETVPQKVRFDDVRGCDEAKQELAEIVEFLKDPSRFTRLGGKLPRGVLLMGPPGTGKTLLARAIAGEAGVPFFYTSGSEFDEMFVGVGARRVRELFSAAKKSAPCILFIDEIDAVGGARNPKDQMYSKMTLNQLLVELDGFQQNEGVIVVGATNFPEMLDKALVRPGRFDHHVNVSLPDIKGRKEILELHLRSIPRAKEVDLSLIARGTPGFSGAELANLVNQAALKASVDGRNAVTNVDLEFAKDKIMMGAERKSAVIDDENRKLTAYHEGGHALMALYTHGAMPIHKATIVPRGRALGMVSQLPETDLSSWAYFQLLARLDVCMGGRAAEELIFGSASVTSGATSDFEQANSIAQAMVTKFGMSEKVGVLVFDKDSNMSSETRNMIDQEVKKILDASYDRAKKMLRSHEKELHRVATALLKHETLNGKEILAAAKGEPIAASL